MKLLIPGSSFHFFPPSATVSIAIPIVGANRRAVLIIISHIAHKYLLTQKNNILPFEKYFLLLNEKAPTYSQ